jgi:hypothetical protein
MRDRIRRILLALPAGVGYRLARGFHMSGGGMVAMTPLQADEFAPPDAEEPLTSEGGMGGDVSRRVRVRADGDVWSDEFRAELRKDRDFEARLVWKEFLILIFISALLVARQLVS